MSLQNMSNKVCYVSDVWRLKFGLVNLWLEIMYCVFDRYPVILTTTQYGRLFAEAGKDEGGSGGSVRAFAWRGNAKLRILSTPYCRLLATGSSDVHRAIVPIIGMRRRMIVNSRTLSSSLERVFSVPSALRRDTVAAQDRRQTFS